MKKNPPDLQHTARSVAAWLKSLPGVKFAFPLIVQRLGKKSGRWPGALYFQEREIGAGTPAHARGERRYVQVALYLVGMPPNMKPGKSFGGKILSHTRNTAYRLSGDVRRLGGWAKREWYLAGYYSPAAVASAEAKQFKQYHPFGAEFQLMPWRVPSGEPIDQFEGKPYARETLLLSLLDQAKSNPVDPAAVKFFTAKAGSSYDPKKETEAQGRARGARQLAAAEAWALGQNYSFTWEVDDSADSSDFSDEKPAWHLWVCTMRDQHGHPVQSLGGVDFGRDGEPWGDDYRRVVEAELALEQMQTVRPRNRTTFGFMPKVNPYATEHAARLVKPIGFVRVRRHNNEFGPGISAVYGIRRKAGPRGGRAILQAIRFDASRFTPAQARAWLRKNQKGRVLRFEPAKNRPVSPGGSARSHRAVARARRNPPVQPLDRPAAHELALYVISTGEYYRRDVPQIMANLRAKIRRGVYDHARAVKLWQYLADRAARDYTREHGTGGGFGIFTPATRVAAAREIQQHYDEELRGGAAAVNPSRRRRAAKSRAAGWIISYQVQPRAPTYYIRAVLTSRAKVTVHRGQAAHYTAIAAHEFLRKLRRRHRGIFRAERY